MVRPLKGKGSRAAASSLDYLARSLDLPTFLLPAFASGRNTALVGDRVEPSYSRAGAGWWRYENRVRLGLGEGPSRIQRRSITSSTSTSAAEAPSHHSCHHAADVARHILRAKHPEAPDDPATEQLLLRLEFAERHAKGWRAPRLLSAATVQAMGSSALADVLVNGTSFRKRMRILARSPVGERYLREGLALPSPETLPVPTSPLPLEELVALELFTHSTRADGTTSPAIVGMLWRLSWHYLGFVQLVSKTDPRALKAALHFSQALVQVVRHRIDPCAPRATPSTEALIRHIRILSIVTSQPSTSDLSSTLQSEAPIVAFLSAQIALAQTTSDHADICTLLRNLSQVLGCRLNAHSVLLLWQAARRKPELDSFNLHHVLASALAECLREDRSVLADSDFVDSVVVALDSAVRAANGKSSSSSKARHQRFQLLLPLLEEFVVNEVAGQYLARHALLRARLALADSSAGVSRILEDEIIFLRHSTASPNPYTTASIARAAASLQDNAARQRIIDLMSWFPDHAFGVISRDLSSQDLEAHGETGATISATLLHAHSLVTRISSTLQYATVGDVVKLFRELAQLGIPYEATEENTGKVQSARRKLLRRQQSGLVAIINGLFGHGSVSAMEAVKVFESTVDLCPEAVPGWMPRRIVGLLAHRVSSDTDASSALCRLLTAVVQWHRTRRRLGLPPLPTNRHLVTFHFGRKSLERVVCEYRGLIEAAFACGGLTELLNRVRLFVDLIEAESHGSERMWKGSAVVDTIFEGSREAARTGVPGFEWTKDPVTWEKVAAIVKEAEERQRVTATEIQSEDPLGLVLRHVRLQVASMMQPSTMNPARQSSLPQDFARRRSHDMPSQFFSPSLLPPASAAPATLPAQKPSLSLVSSVDKGMREYTNQSLLYALCAVAAESFEGWWQRSVVQKLEKAEAEALEEAKDEAARASIVDGLRESAGKKGTKR